MLEDEGERDRRDFPGARTLGPALGDGRLSGPPTPNTPTTPTPGAGQAFSYDPPAVEAAARRTAMGLSNPEYCHPDNLEDLKAEIPHLAAKGDRFLLQMKISTLIKMESNYIKRASQDKGRSIEETLAKNQDAVAASPIPVAAGFDDRNGSLHPARFLPGPICSAQELWLQARRVWGSSGPPPVAAFDLASIGLAGHITAKGFAALQDPGSSSLSLRLFDVANVTTKVEASKRITLSASSDSMEVGDSLKEASTLYSFQQALRAVRELARFTMPWNHSFAALEGFLVCNSYMARDLGNTNSHAIGVLAKFCDHIFELNASRWRASKHFLDINELGSTWATWLASRGGPISQRAGSAAHQAAAAGSGQSSGQKAAKPAKPKAATPASGGQAAGRAQAAGGAQAAARAAAAAVPDDICQRFNKNKCPNAATGNCTTAAGLALRHVCNYITGPNTKCLQPHMRILNH
jgi:hypothetical protein